MSFRIASAFGATLVVTLASHSSRIAGAYETDQLTGRHLALRDCRQVVNDHVTGILDAARTRAERKAEAGISDADAGELLRNELASLNPFDMKWLGATSEVWMRRDLAPLGYAVLTPGNLYSDYLSMLGGPGWDPAELIPFFFSWAHHMAGHIVSPTFRIGDVRFGADKISHFFRLGHRYWGKSHLGRDERRALRYGTASENGTIGMMMIGIFSYADLAANHAGYRFFKNLVAPEARRAEDLTHFTLIRENGRVRYRPARPFDFAEYASDDWDEFLNPSAYKPEVRAAVDHYLRGNRCELCAEVAQWPESARKPQGPLIPLENYVYLPKAPERRDPYLLDALCSPEARARAGCR